MPAQFMSEADGGGVLDSEESFFRIDIEKIYAQITQNELNPKKDELEITSSFYGTFNQPEGFVSDAEMIRIEMGYEKSKTFYIERDPEFGLDYYTAILNLLYEDAPYDIESYDFSKKELLNEFSNHINSLIYDFEYLEWGPVIHDGVEFVVKDWIKLFPKKIDSFIANYCVRILKSNKVDSNNVKSTDFTESNRSSRYISEKVRDAVWRRDEGKCTKCGSNENLEFDHIIPHSKGGANTKRNIQLLCEICNRKKSDNIG